MKGLGEIRFVFIQSKEEKNTEQLFSGHNKVKKIIP